jgi:ABC-type uncharacterized transport system permease subunit
MMGKYIGFFQLEFKQLNEFKLDFFLFWMEALLKCSLMLLFWNQLWSRSEGHEFSEINQAEFMGMILITQFMLLPYRGSERISQLIEQPVISGRMALVLCRPIHPLAMNLSRVVCQHGRMLFLALILLLLVHSLFFHSLTGHDLSLKDVPWHLVVPSLLLSILINFFIFTAIGLFSFWIGDVWSILYVLGILAGFFSGQFYPLHLNADLEFWSRWLPFRYIGYSPALIYMGMAGLEELLRQLLSTLVLAFICFKGFNVALRKFEANGG